MLKRKSNSEPKKTKLEKRVESLRTEDLVSWGEQALFGIGRAMSDFSKTGEEVSLQESYQGAVALSVVLKEIANRKNIEVSSE